VTVRINCPVAALNTSKEFVSTGTPLDSPREPHTNRWPSGVNAGVRCWSPGSVHSRRVEVVSQTESSSEPSPSDSDSGPNTTRRPSGLSTPALPAAAGKVCCGSPSYPYRTVVSQNCRSLNDSSSGDRGHDCYCHLHRSPVTCAYRPDDGSKCCTLAKSLWENKIGWRCPGEAENRWGHRGQIVREAPSGRVRGTLHP
jgi:hypothetical protein